MLSFYGKVNYDYNDKYVASATFRRDGSSRFGQDNRWGNYYAGSAGWRIDKEAFLVNNSFIDRLFLRGGYGVIGNQEIGNYVNQSLLGSNYNYPFGGVKSNGYAVTQYGNADVRWESSTQLNVGVDMAILQGRFSLTLDYFDKTTKDLLGNLPYPTSVGYAASPTVNNGKVQNKGVELGLNFTQKISSDLSFTISPNAAYLHNEVVSINTPKPDGLIGSSYLTMTDKGHPLGSFFLYKQTGIFQTAADIFTSAVPAGVKALPGDVKYADINGDGKIDQNDRTYVGSPIPKFTGGLNFQVNYKNFDLSAFFQGAYGQKIFSVLNVDLEGFYRPFNVTERYFDNHWTPEHPSNQFPRASFAAYTNNDLYSTRFLENGSYTRLKNLQVGYTIPKSILNRYGLNTMRIYFSGTNLLTWTKYSGMDPEMTASDNAKGSGDRANGIDWGT